MDIFQLACADEIGPIIDEIFPDLQSYEVHSRLPLCKLHEVVAFRAANVEMDLLLGQCIRDLSHYILDLFVYVLTVTG